MTVVVQSLFEPLPVRRKELLSSINSTSRKEYCKLLAIVQSYAVVAVNVRFVCSSTIAEFVL
jgi:DNA mismatch repair ATPase MutL